MQSTRGLSGLIEMLRDLGPIAQSVLSLLLVASVYSWTVILSKWSLFSRATTQSRRFIRAYRNASRLQEIPPLAEECSASPLARVFEDIYDAYMQQIDGSDLPLDILALERAAQSAASEAVTALERRMTWLATIGSVSPFVGLFGTVMGVIDAFLGLGEAGSATLRAVGPGIAEALITTAAGLFVAVPAVVAYNQYTARIRNFASTTDDFCRELLNSLSATSARMQAWRSRMLGEMPRDAERGMPR